MKKYKREYAEQADVGNGVTASIQNICTMYIRSTGSSVRIYNRSLQLLFDLFDEHSVESSICKYCPAAAGKENCGPCHELHVNAIEQSRNSDGLHIYTCEMGLVFMTSPLFNKGAYAGSLRGAGYLSCDTKLEDVSASGEFIGQLQTLKRANPDKIKSLGEMLRLCAAYLSPGSENNHDMLRRRTGQQKEIMDRLNTLKSTYRSRKKPGYPIKKEQELIEAIQRGNMEASASCLNDLLAIMLFINQGNFLSMQTRATELVALLSGSDKDSGYGEYVIPCFGCMYARQIKKAKTFDELADILHTMVKHITESIAPFRGIPHVTAMKKAERFIQENFTRKNLLSEISSAVGFSAPYFSTIFREEMGENFSTYLNRMRVEKAKYMLLETRLPLSEIASACCFEDQSWFCRIFKSITSITPGKFRQQGGMYAKI